MQQTTEFKQKSGKIIMRTYAASAIQVKVAVDHLVLIQESKVIQFLSAIQYT